MIRIRIRKDDTEEDDRMTMMTLLIGRHHQAVHPCSSHELQGSHLLHLCCQDGVQLLLHTLLPERHKVGGDCQDYPGLMLGKIGGVHFKSLHCNPLMVKYDQRNGWFKSFKVKFVQIVGFA